MVTGKNLTRLISCNLWKNTIESIDEYCSYQIYDKNGKKISAGKAKVETFCHIRILFKDLAEDKIRVISQLLKEITDSAGEYCCKSNHSCYGFVEVIIS